MQLYASDVDQWHNCFENNSISCCVVCLVCATHKEHKTFIDLELTVCTEQPWQWSLQFRTPTAKSISDSDQILIVSQCSNEVLSICQDWINNIVAGRVVKGGRVCEF